MLCFKSVHGITFEITIGIYFILYEKLKTQLQSKNN